tara:strand:+ start:128 stop:586 length:459 start_codon:yes stop_codon:yes gene_type:complete
MDPRLTFKLAITLVLVISAMLFVGCGGGSADQVVVSDQPPVVVEWSIGPKGGLNKGSALITQASWQPKKLVVPVGRPFIIRFVPRDDKSHPIVFSKSLKEETGLELQDLMVSGGNPADTPPMVIHSYGKGLDIYCREHRGVAGFGTLVTPSK